MTQHTTLPRHHRPSARAIGISPELHQPPAWLAMSLVTTSISAAPSLERSASGRAWPGTLGTLGWFGFGLGLARGSHQDRGFRFGCGSRDLNYSTPCTPSCARRGQSATRVPLTDYYLPAMFYLLCTPYSFTILRSKKPHHKVVLLLTDLPATYSVLPTP